MSSSSDAPRNESSWPGARSASRARSGQAGITSRHSPVPNTAARLEDSRATWRIDPGCPGPRRRAAAAAACAVSAAATPAGSGSPAATGAASAAASRISASSASVKSAMAGAKPGGWVVIEVWESRDAQGQFMNDRLGEALQKGGITDPAGASRVGGAGGQPQAGALPPGRRLAVDRGDALDQLDPVAVGIAHEAQAVAALADRVGRALGLDALPGERGERRVEVRAS